MRLNLLVVGTGLSDAQLLEELQPCLLQACGLLAYGYLIGVHVDDLIDDAVDLPAQIRTKQLEAGYFAQFLESHANRANEKKQ